MTFGISAAAAAWIAVGVTAAGTVYSADQQRKAIHGQMDATRAAQEDDARRTAEAETQAQVSANAQRMDTKRRRRANALELGALGGTVASLGGSGPALAAGGPAPAARAAGTALGAGSAPRAPMRGQAI